MKYFLTIIILIKLLTFNVFAEWSNLLNSSFTEIYIDYKALEKKDNQIKITLLTDLGSPKDDIRSIKSLHQIDCNNKINDKVLSFLAYKKRMGEGEFTDIDKPKSVWNFIGQEIREKTLYTICNLKTEFAIGDKVYFHANEGNPQVYFKNPLNIKNKIIEVGNEITGLNKSPYGREFTTRATSKITLPNDKIVTAKLDDFRNLVITDDKEKVLLESKVSGATSIYAFKHNNNTVAWGVGWHIAGIGKGYHDVTDFTVLSTYIPVLNNNEIKVHYHYLRPNISEYYDSIKDSSYPIFLNARTVYSNAKPMWCYYCGLDFIYIDNIKGLVPVTSVEEINKYNIDHYNIQPLIAANSLAESICDLKERYAVYFDDKEDEFKCYESDINQEKFLFYKSLIKSSYKEIIHNVVYDWNGYYHQSSETFHSCKGYEGKKNYEDLYYYKYPRYLRSLSKKEQKKILIKNYKENCNFDNLFSYEMIAKTCFQPFESFMNNSWGSLSVGMKICPKKYANIPN